MTSQTSRAWHQFPYVWMMLLIPFSAVIMGVIMISLAVDSSSGLVVDDYYKKGKEINRVLARDKQAKLMGIQATLTFDPETGKLLVEVNSNGDVPLDEQLQMDFFHSTREGKDQLRVLHALEGNSYTSRIEKLPAGRWNIQIGTEDWRITGSLKTPDDVSSQLFPAIQ